MILFYGIRSSEVLNAEIEENCTKCEAQKSLRASVHQEFFHLFWIPLLPVEKNGVLYCTHCEIVVPQERLIPHFQELYLNVQKKAKTPWWNFSGLMIIAFIIALAIVGPRIYIGYIVDCINDPHKKDLYEVAIGDDNYTLYFVQDVSADSVYVLVSEYQTNESSGLAGLESKRFNPKKYPISKKELKSMYAERKILDIKRSGW